MLIGENVFFFFFSSSYTYLRIPKNPRSAKQWIKLTGLGCDAFDLCATAILEIYQVFSSQLPPQALQPWTPSTENGYLVLELSNRYFSDQEVVDEEIPLTDVWGPLHLLRNWMPSDARHSRDNEVLYYERRFIDGQVYFNLHFMRHFWLFGNRAYEYISVNPTGIQVGNVVEAQVAFCVVPIGKQGKYKMITKLRSLCTLDRSVERVSYGHFRSIINLSN